MQNTVIPRDVRDGRVPGSIVLDPRFVYSARRAVVPTRPGTVVLMVAAVVSGLGCGWLVGWAAWFVLVIDVGGPW